jgi:hypothetical protein
MKAYSLLAGFLLTSASAGFCQPSNPIVKLRGHAQTVNDTFHPYANPSASLGADLELTVTAGGPGPFGYQWRFFQTDLADQTNATLRLPYLQFTNAGDYTVLVTNSSGAVTSLVTTLTVDGAFTKITTGPVVTDPGFSSGGTFGDYNNSGFPSLFVYNGANGAAVPYLYRNQGGTNFIKITSGPPVNVLAQAQSALWFDYDNKGSLDLYVVTGAPSLLFHNTGNGTFTRILTGPLVTDVASTLAAAAADYNGDGFVDLFVATIDSNAHSRCFLYRNNGDGTFTSVTNNNILVTDLASSVGCAWGYISNDRHPDLFVTGGRGDGAPAAPNRLYRNNGDGTFTRITTGSIVTDLGHCGPCVWADFSNSGFLDLFVVNAFGSTNFYYHNNGNGTFTSITNDIVATDVAPPLSGGGGGSWSCAAGDYDNDGFLDLAVANLGDSSIVPAAVNFFYHNNGDGTFTKVRLGSLGNEYSDATGIVWEDYDNDGSLDLFVARRSGGGNYLYHNNGNTNAWLIIKLIGTVSNRAAIGAKVRVKASYCGASRWQLRQITGGSGYAGHDELRAHFGLGDATNADIVRIEWPSGAVQEFYNVAPKQLLTFTEPPRLLAGITNGIPQFSIKGGRGMQYEIDSSPDLSVWSSIGTVIVTNLNGTAPIIDTNPPAADKRFYRAFSR